MHLLTTTTEINLGENGKLSPGQYLAEDVNVGQIMAEHHGLEVSPASKCFRMEHRRFDPKLDWNGKKLLIVRPGAYGDLVLLTPVLAELKRLWPTLEIRVACFPKYGAVFENLNLCEVIQYPVPTEVALAYDAWVFLEATELNPLSRSLHLTDFFASFFRIILEQKHALYRVSEAELEQAGVVLDGDEGRRIGVQVEPSGACRHYAHMARVIQLLHGLGWNIYLFGEPGTINLKSQKRLTNCAAMGLAFRQSAAILSCCEIFLGPDSALLHVAGALAVPAVGLYGPFPWKIRTDYANTTFAIQGNGTCAPCFHHSRTHEPFPENGPCSKTGRCEVLADITPERVVAKIEQVYANSQKPVAQPLSAEPSPV